MSPGSFSAENVNVSDMDFIAHKLLISIFKKHRLRHKSISFDFSCTLKKYE